MWWNTCTVGPWLSPVSFIPSGSALRRNEGIRKIKTDGEKEAEEGFMHEEEVRLLILGMNTFTCTQSSSTKVFVIKPTTLMSMWWKCVCLYYFVRSGFSAPQQYPPPISNTFHLSISLSLILPMHLFHTLSLFFSLSLLLSHPADAEGSRFDSGWSPHFITTHELGRKLRSVTLCVTVCVCVCPQVEVVLRFHDEKRPDGLGDDKNDYYS